MNTRRRLPIGQLLGRTLRSFREDLYRRAQEAGYRDLREAHLQVFGAIDWTGTRLTELAARANMTPPSMAELVDELQQAGYLERRPDPSDGRAKLIRPTRKGRRVLAQALRAVEEIERGYAEAVGPERFDALAATLQDLLDARPRGFKAERRRSTGSDDLQA
ncbi:MAG: MarR family transcriptional regulator [Candidatus Limnocylindrales bacterium]|nr:MarR family transcriptional regulator [Candidatus Limnocylindrales bacterium]